MVTKEQARPVWKCSVEGCNYIAAPTVEGYRKLSGHQLAHTGLPKTKRGFQLVDERTGEILAQKLEEATTKGFIATEPAAPASPPAPEAKPAPSKEPLSEVEPPKAEPPKAEPAKVEPPKAEPPKAEPAKVEPPKAEPAKVEPEAEEKAETTIVKTPGVFTYEITLPADAFTLFNLAKAYGLEPNDGKLFDEWVWDCIRARYSKDYKQQLVLAPVEE